ncbi:hypothetical protein Pla163_01880 [Planctomycetes bacterium Pla163]|uniref:YokE-like PH domain-containing protein n=1 Tax=Rohdeia mirabilis TaxID=2528008 RepID=A0A518CV42_9BACT|nr:hypothetical protein Pla163_01880 [Planctomycetes bacterium Pla163]
MPTLDDVLRQIRALASADTFGTTKEVRHLPDVLFDDEPVLGITSGMMAGDTWLIVCTDRRVVLLNRGLVYGLKQREMPLERINSIEHSTGLVLGSIAIWDGADRMEIRNVVKQTVMPFVDAVNRARVALGSERASGDDRVTQLERLADLRERGALTEAEFDEQKRRVLEA